VCVCADCLNVREFMCKLAGHVRESVSVQNILNSTCSSRTIMVYNPAAWGSIIFILYTAVFGSNHSSAAAHGLQIMSLAVYLRRPLSIQGCMLLQVVPFSQHRQQGVRTSTCALDHFISKDVQSSLRQPVHPLLPASTGKHLTARGTCSGILPSRLNSCFYTVR
jgi:hypothetical protein